MKEFAWTAPSIFQFLLRLFLFYQCNVPVLIIYPWKLMEPVNFQVAVEKKAV